MIVDLKTAISEFPNVDEAKLKRKIKALEMSVRAFTNNKFLDTRCRTKATIKDNTVIVEVADFFRENDSIELTHCLDNGPYTIDVIDGLTFTLDNDLSLLDTTNALITKISYPKDIQEGILKLLDWDFGVGKKVGIKSETLSRHSVTYFDMDKNNSLQGYPASLIGFLNNYVKARF